MWRHRRSLWCDAREGTARRGVAVPGRGGGGGPAAGCGAREQAGLVAVAHCGAIDGHCGATQGRARQRAAWPCLDGVAWASSWPSMITDRVLVSVIEVASAA